MCLSGESAAGETRTQTTMPNDAEAVFFIMSGVKTGLVGRALYTVFALGAAHLLLLAGVEAQRYWALRAEQRIVSGQVEALRAEVHALKGELAHAEDPGYLEAKARGLGYVYPDEVLHAPPR